MRKLKICFIVLFFAVLMIPVAAFNRESNAVSEIDNRMLAETPFDNSEDLTESIEIYLEDRIGLRNAMISAYTKLNDTLFHEMVHPSYTYGKDGYIFLRTGGNTEFWDYYVEFADMVYRIQEYCEERDVPFLFVFDPAKATVLRDELEPGTNYNNDWVDRFFEELDKRGVNYVDNTEILEEKTKEGEAVFNKQYDAGHWNDLGAFYGVNNMLEALKKRWPAVHVNTMDEFDIGEWTATVLPNSEIPINDVVPDFVSRAQLEDLTEQYDAEVKRDEQNRHFAYVVNEERKAEGSPKALVFQGSYMNGQGHKFLENSLGEYIAVHDYYNVTNFDYYYNIFKPDCVIFEVGEYTVLPDYFPYESVQGMSLNPLYESVEDLPETEADLSALTLSEENGDMLTVIHVSGVPEDTQYAWLFLDGEEFDLKRAEGSEVYTVTVENEKLENARIEITAASDGGRIIYSSEGDAAE